MWKGQSLNYFVLPFLLLASAMLVACAPDCDENSLSPANLNVAPAKPIANEIPKTTVTLDWAPENVVLTCALPECPQQVGVLIFVTKTDSSHLSLKRCTAFLIDADKIMTSGHCDQAETTAGYFITRTDFPGSAIRKVNKLLFKKFTANSQDPELLSGRPDVAVFQLEKPITNIPPLKLASGRPKAFARLIAIVANSVPGASAIKLTIGRLDCNAHRNERYFPFDVSEGPDVIRAFDCGGEKGNSGAPMFSENGPEVEAVFEGAEDRAAFASLVLEKSKRALFPFEAHTTVEATNVHCLGFPQAPEITCVTASDEEMQRRFTSQRRDSLAQLSQRDLANGGNYDTAFRTLAYQLKSSPSSSCMRFEILHFPKCRIVDGPLKKLIMPIETLAIDWDEWAKPRTVVTQTSYSTGIIKSQTAASAEVRMDWAPPSGEFAESVHDPRVQLGKAFSIALPLCPR